MEVTLLPSRARNLATLSRAKQEASESIANIRACSRHINREVILSEPQAGEVAQHLQAAEQSLQKAQFLEHSIQCSRRAAARCANGLPHGEATFLSRPLWQ